MRTRKASRLFLTLYIGAYLCLLAPLHLHHLTTDFQLHEHIEQSHHGERLRTPHHDNSCPTCQLNSGLIDLPALHDHTTFYPLVRVLTDVDTSSLAVIGQPRPSSRAPPAIA